jgi:hypothetical protein
MNRLSRFMGGPISRWFCAIHPHEFLIFTYAKRHRSFCPKCRWGE